MREILHREEADAVRADLVARIKNGIAQENGIAGRLIDRLIDERYVLLDCAHYALALCEQGKCTPMFEARLRIALKIAEADVTP